jgi:hypothetical protein
MHGSRWRALETDAPRPRRVKLEACRETGRPYANRLPSTTMRTAPAPDPTRKWPRGGVVAMR